MKFPTTNWNEVQEEVISTQEQTTKADGSKGSIDAKIEVVGIVAFFLDCSCPSIAGQFLDMYITQV
jgi:hypothetical protein